MKTLFDLPAHPLLVHAPVVLLPLVAIVAIVAAVWPGVARRLGVWLPVATLLVFVSVLFAMNSGEALDKAVNLGTAEKHESLAKTTRLLSLGMLVTTAGLWWVTRRSIAARSAGAAAATRRDPVATVIAVLVIVFAVLSTIWLIRTGHEGARIHWDGVIKDE